MGAPDSCECGLQGGCANAWALPLTSPVSLDELLKLFFKCILLIMLLQLSQFFPLCAPPPGTPSHQHHPLLSSCLWVIYISSLASPFSILFLTSPCLFSTYQLCFLIPASFPPFSPFTLPADNLPNHLHTYDSIPVLVVCLGFICLFVFVF